MLLFDKKKIQDLLKRKIEVEKDLESRYSKCIFEFAENLRSHCWFLRGNVCKRNEWFAFQVKRERFWSSSLSLRWRPKLGLLTLGPNVSADVFLMETDRNVKEVEESILEYYLVINIIIFDDTRTERRTLFQCTISTKAAQLILFLFWPALSAIGILVELLISGRMLARERCRFYLPCIRGI